MRNKQDGGAREKREPLSLWDIQQILLMRRQGLGIRKIGRKLNRNHSVVSKLLKSIPYSPYLASLSPLELAREMYLRRQIARSKPRRKERLKNQKIRDYVEEKLKLNDPTPGKYKKWTPENIAGRLSIDHPELSISHESIYQWIYSERKDLVKYLRIAGSERRRKRSGLRKRRYPKDVAAPKLSIDAREEIVGNRGRLGDWEGDSIVSKQSQYSILTLVERRSRYLDLSKMPACNSDNAEQAITDKLGKYPPEMRKTLTFDNGGEFANHKEIDRALGTQTYFCHPGSPQERGTVENRNRFVRQFFPKKTDLRIVSLESLKAVEEANNDRPMKVLGFLTPREVFSGSIAHSRSQSWLIQLSQRS